VPTHHGHHQLDVLDGFRRHCELNSSRHASADGGAVVAGIGGTTRSPNASTNTQNRNRGEACHRVLIDDSLVPPGSPGALAARPTADVIIRGRPSGSNRSAHGPIAVAPLKSTAITLRPCLRRDLTSCRSVVVYRPVRRSRLWLQTGGLPRLAEAGWLFLCLSRFAHG
jgi:hypothetical protein